MPRRGVKTLKKGNRPESTRGGVRGLEDYGGYKVAGNPLKTLNLA